MKKLILHNDLSPGDILVMTAAVRDLHLTFPEEYQTDVDSPCPEIWEHSPYVTKLKKSEAQYIKMQYPSIHRSGWRGTHFSEGHTKYLSRVLDRKINISSLLPEVHLSDEERTWTSQVEDVFGYKGPFWILNAGVKSDYTLKQYPYYQECVDILRDRVQFVQVGAGDHTHKPLDGVLNLVGKTDGRQIIRLMYHAEGCVTGVSYPMHLAAAYQKPCVVVAGGREPVRWEMYPNHQYLAVNGCLPCAAYNGCWKNKLKDCENLVGGNPRCMAMILPAQVAQSVLNYYTGGLLRHASN